MDAAFGISNLIKAATLTATSSEATMPPDNLADDRGAAASGWQSASGVTTATLTATLASDSNVRAVGLFRSNLWIGATVNLTVRHSGVDVWTATLSGPQPGYGQVVFVRTEGAVLADTVVVEIIDSSNPDGFLNVALMYAGDLWLPTYGIGPDSGYNVDSNSIEMVSRGGQEYVTLLYQQRRFDFALEAVVSSEAWAYAGEIMRLSPLGGNFLFVPDIGSTEIGREPVFGRIKKLGDVKWRAGLVDIRQWSGSVLERL